MKLVRFEDWAGTSVPHPGSKLMARPVGSVFVHHSAGPHPLTEAAEVDLLRQYDRQHRKKGWSGLGYSFAIGPSGTVYEGRGEKVGAHTEGFNSQGYGICLLGNFQTAGPTQAALASLIELIFHLERVGAVRFPATIQGHRDKGATACPGNILYAKLPEVRDALNGEPVPDPNPTPVYKVNARPVGIATVGENSYLILCADGGVFTFGPEAKYHGRVEEPAPGAWQ